MTGLVACCISALLAETPQPRLEELDPNMAVADAGADVRWYNVLDIGLEGQGWDATKQPFDRLPAAAEGVVRDAVWRAVWRRQRGHR